MMSRTFVAISSSLLVTIFLLLLCPETMLMRSVLLAEHMAPYYARITVLDRLRERAIQNEDAATIRDIDQAMESLEAEYVAFAAKQAGAEAARQTAEQGSQDTDSGSLHEASGSSKTKTGPAHGHARADSHEPFRVADHP
jgi:hypothetical protein